MALAVAIFALCFSCISAASTWGEVKQCSMSGALDCHEKCKKSLDPDVQDKMRNCEMQLASQLFASLEGCFNSRGFEVNNDTTCWRRTDNLTKHLARLRRQAESLKAKEDTLTKILDQLEEYNYCYNHCLHDSQDTFTRGCNKDCEPMTKRRNVAVVEHCIDEVFDDSMATLVMKFFVPCGLRAFGLKDGQ